MGVAKSRWVDLRTASQEHVDVSIDSLKRAINSGQLPAKLTAPQGGKFLVRVSDLEAWCESLEDA